MDVTVEISVRLSGIERHMTWVLIEGVRIDADLQGYAIDSRYITVNKERSAEYV